MAYVKIDGETLTLLSSSQELILNDSKYSARTWKSWSNSDLANHGIYPLVYDDSAPTRFHTSSGIDEYEIIEGVVHASHSWTAMPLDTAKDIAYSLLAEWRWEKEIGGITFGEISIPTDRETQAKVAGAYIKGQADSEYVIDNWKFALNTFMSLDVQTIIEIGDAIVSHVQACFNEEANYSNQITEAETVEEIETILQAYPR